MLIINFIFVALFAFVAEYLRVNVFKFSNLFRKTSTKVSAPAAAAPKVESSEIEIKSAKAKELYEMHKTLQLTK